MKSVHYNYWLSHKRQRYLADIRDIIHTFTGIKNEAFRKSFSNDDGDNLLLYPISGDVFLFVVTKDKEFIKAISATTLDQAAITTRLSAGEHVGFASYICIAPYAYSIASTFHGPKQGRWDAFVNDLFEKVGRGDITFYSKAVPTAIGADQAMNFAFKSSVKLQLRQGHHITQQFSSWFGGDPDLNEIEVIIKPPRGGELITAWRHIREYIDDKAVKKVVVKGKEEINDTLSDFFIVGTGHAYDTIESVEEKGIVAEMQHALSRNTMLKETINEFKQDNAYSKTPIPGFARLRDVSGWPSRLAGVAKH